MACPECEAARQQYLTAQRTASLMARALDQRGWWFRRRSSNPSVTELLTVADRRQPAQYPSWRLIAVGACIWIALDMIFV